MNRQERRRLKRFTKIPKHIQTKLVNKKGEVPLTQTEMFGCDIFRGIPDYVRDVCDEFNFGEIIVVPFGEEGFPIGGRGKCHENVYSLTRRIGGEMLRGYIILPIGNEKYYFFYHSIWITPEGKSVCITERFPTEVLDSDLDEYLFLPIGLGFISHKPISLSPMEVIVSKGWETLGVQIFRTNDRYEEIKKGNTFFDREGMKEIVNQTGGLFRKTPPDESFFCEKTFLQKSNFIDTGTKWEI